MSLTFPMIEAWDGSIDCVSFPADENGVRIRCLISWEALQDNFGGELVSPLDSFRQSRGRIEQKIRELHSRKRVEPDGSIFIRTQDGA